MEHWIQAVPAIVLIVALLLAIHYVHRHWRNWPQVVGKESLRLNRVIEGAMPRFSSDLGRIRRRFRNELSRIMPLWSAATTENREAEFINDRLLERLPYWLAALAVVVLAALAWLSQ